MSPDNPFQRDIYTVSRLNSEVRSVLEGSFPLLWVEGEISNLARPSSGHIYFSLKDSRAQVRCAMFRMKRQLLRFQPENGLTVQIRAKVGLYEGRGEFQLIVEHMEAGGEGALRQAFDALKLQLSQEGLFETERKQGLPSLASRVGLITSPSGAAIRDVITVMNRRYPAMPILIYPVSVQGDKAPQEIIEALRLANRRKECDLLILTRGGGSLEDLMAFNDEQVARAIADSEIPVISAVGHEIDFTIADFVADQRAPTPSAAAELATPDQRELEQQIRQLKQRLQRQQGQQVELINHRFRALQQRLARVHPELQLNQKRQRLDTMERQLQSILSGQLMQRGEQIQLLKAQLSAVTPQHRLQKQSHQFQELYRRLAQATRDNIQNRRHLLQAEAGKLNTLSPLATLDRGYSITREATQQRVLHSNESISKGDRIETLLRRGKITSLVEKVES